MAISCGWRPGPTRSLPADSISELLKEALSAGFSFLCVPLQVKTPEPVAALNHNHNQLLQLQRTLIAASDRALQDEWFNRVVLEFTVFNEFLLQYAAYLSVCAVLVTGEAAADGRFLDWHRDSGEPFQLWIQFDADTEGWLKWRQLKSRRLHSTTGSATDAKSASASASTSSRVKVALGFTDYLERAWLAEPIGAVLCAPSAVAAAELVDLLAADGSIALVLQSEQARFRPTLPTTTPSSAVDVFAGGFKNVLQSPLQPLKDHLPAETYRCFEQDPVKYRLYEEAILQALTAMKSSHKSVRVAVVGAGRGPLVAAVLSAAETAEMELESVTAVERNPFACMGLIRRFQPYSRVEVVLGDMRTFKPSSSGRPFHLVVSELLGSLGDNELAPECLQPLEQFLTADAVMIPQRYTSFLRPAYAPLLREAAANGDGLDVPYVAYITKAHYWDTQPQPLLTFEHPCRKGSGISECSEEEEEVSLEFSNLPRHCVIDCLVGYFECQLFGSVMMSTLPGNHSKGMCSWFPAFLPLRKVVEGAETLLVHFRRRKAGERIWYEWRASAKGAELESWQNDSGQAHAMHL